VLKNTVTANDSLVRITNRLPPEHADSLLSTTTTIASSIPVLSSSL
jgi:hypothetical protein